jgi:hypothetical protein
MSEQTDLVVLGGTPAGVAAAVRGAREGLDVDLFTYNDHLGGMMAGGLSRTDAVLEDRRAPIFDEVIAGIREHYRSTYGSDSDQFEACEDGFVFEPHVAEGVFDDLVEGEADVACHFRYTVSDVTRDGRTVRAAAFEPRGDGVTVRRRADAFVDATYEGDLAATAGVDYRVGRESRAEYDEQHAGRIYTYTPAATGLPTPRFRGCVIGPGSTGQGDDAVQSYNYRLCLSREPENRRRPDRPDGYDCEEFEPIFESGTPADTHLDGHLVEHSPEEIREMGIEFWLGMQRLPNDKADLNTADLIGGNHEYPKADWEQRDAIAKRHREHVLGLLYFLQNDEAVPEDVQDEVREWGLATDEFVDTGNVPFQLYVREARRIHGRETFTENDARLADGSDRTPVAHDGVAIADFLMDSHGCTTPRQENCLAEGFFGLSGITKPSQVPYGIVLPRDIDNLLVPVAASATHVGFGTIRLEPVWAQLGEVAGVASAMAAGSDTAPANLAIDRLQHRLAESAFCLSHFEDVGVGDDDPWVAPIQYLGTKGFFRRYQARPTDVLDADTADAWCSIAGGLAAGEAGRAASAIPASPDAGPLSVESFATRLDAEGVEAFPAVDALDLDDGATVSRGDACRIVYRALDDGD